MYKKLASLILAIILCLSLAVPAFATDVLNPADNTIIRTEHNLGDVSDPSDQLPLDEESNVLSRPKRSVVTEWRFDSMRQTGTKHATKPVFFAQQPGKDGSDWCPSLSVSYSGGFSASISTSTQSYIEASFGFDFSVSKDFTTSVCQPMRSGTTYTAYYLKQWALFDITEKLYWWDDARMDWVTEGTTRKIRAQQPLLPEIIIEP